MLEKSLEQVLTVVFGKERVSDFVPKILKILRNEVAHLATFGMAPAVLNHMQFGRLRREALLVYARVIGVPEPPRGLAMAAEAIPHHPQWSPEVSVKLLDEGEDIVAGDVGGRDGKVQALSPPFEPFAREGFKAYRLVAAMPALPELKCAP